MTQQLQAIHQHCLQIAELSFAARLRSICELFMGVKYGPWVNGSDILAFDDFNYDLNKLDCVTYVEVVLALVKTKPSSNFEQFSGDFLHTLRHIHYANGIPNFLNSNHFTCVDWVVNNKYVVEDITQNLGETKIAQTCIDRLSFFRRHRINAGKECELTPTTLPRLKAQESRIPYIETNLILNNYAHFVEIFPEYCIVNIVRPNWDIVEAIGTHLNISHLGFAIKDEDRAGIKYFHATIEKMAVIVEGLDVYMQRHVDSPTIRGINVLAVSPGFLTNAQQTVQC